MKPSALFSHFALVGLLAFAGCDQTSQGNVSPDALVGRWRVAEARGVSGNFDFDPTWIDFTEAGDFSANDGCNPVHGVYKLESDGSFRAGTAPGDFEGGTECANGQVEFLAILEDVEKTEISGGTVRFLDKQGTEVLVLSRA